MRAFAAAVVIILALSIFPAGASGRSPQTALVREGFVTGADGVRLHYRIVGRGRPTMVFLHGGPGLHMGNGWPDLAGIGDGRTVLLYDQRGGGRSTLVRDARHLTAQDHVRDLEALRRLFRVGRMQLVGYSWGAGLATLYASQFPERVERLLLLSPMPPAKIPFANDRSARERALTPPSELTRIEALEREMPGAADPAAICRESDRLGYQAYFFDIANLARMKGDNCDAPPEALRNTGRVYSGTIGSLGNWDFRPLARRLYMPVLVVEGQESQVAAGSPRAWAEAFPNGALLEIPGAGHMPHIEQPELFFPAVRRFLTRR